jgi:hypothetical protein
MAQQIIVILIVAAAVFYIGRMLWNTVAGKGGCHNCSANHASGSRSVKVPEHLIKVQTSSKRHGKTN